MGWWKRHSQLCGRNEKLVPDTSIEMKILADNWWHCDCLVQVLGPMLPCPDSFRIETSALWYHVAFHIVHRILSIDSNRKKPFIVILSFVNLAEKTSFERKKIDSLHLNWLSNCLPCQLIVLKPMVNFQLADSKLPSTTVLPHKF